ncbi:(R)-mandelonitrile lyase [Ranunculus cassubicifolius]
METVNTLHHFVLVHGLGQGAWCWYKVKTILESSGHRVTALDLAASGTNLKKLSDVYTMLDYSEPLLAFMATIPDGEKVILVGHSLGGINIAYAMERFPLKVSIAVFITAFMPDAKNRQSYVIEQFLARAPADLFLDSKSSLEEGPVMPKSTILFGPKFSASKLYQLSPIEDFTLGIILLRVGSLFLEDLSVKRFSEEGYGTVKKAYIVCKDDQVVVEDFQQWMIKNIFVNEVKTIEGADHFPMFSKTQEVCHVLTELASKYV